MTAKYLTIDASSGSYVDNGADKNNNLQVLCEAFGGANVDGQGVGTWATAETKTVTDARVTSDSVIFIQAYGSQTPNGIWTVTSRSAGSFVITSTDTELSGTTFWYSVINI
jgi:hypothetical protein